MRTGTRGPVSGHDDRRSSWLLPLAMLAGMFPAMAAAQDVPLGSPPGFESPSGLKVGNFDLYLRGQAGLATTNNIREDSSEEGDERRVLAAAGALRSDWKRHALAFGGSYFEKRGIDFHDQFSNALDLNVSGRIDFSDTLSLSLGVLRDETIIDKNSPLQFSGNLQGTSIEDVKEFELAWKDEKYFAKLQGRDDEIDNETDIDTTVVARVQVQDRIERDLTLQVGTNRDWGQLYLLGGGGTIDYTGSAVILPEDRDSRNRRFGVGYEMMRSDLSIVGRAIYFRGKFNASTIKDVSGVVGTLQARLAVNEDVAVAAKIERVFDEVNIQNSGGLFQTSMSLGLQHRLSKDVYWQAGPTGRHYRIVSTNLEADAFAFDGKIAWQAHPRVEFILNGSLLTQSVNDVSLADLEYTSNYLMLSTVIVF